MHADQTPFEPPATEFGAAPPTQAGGFVPLAPPEGWPTVIGVLSIIFGSLASLQGFCGLLGLIAFSSLLSFLPQEVQDQMGTQMQSSMPYPGFQALQILTEFGVAILLLVGGIMLVRRKPKSRGVLTAFAWIDLLSNTYVAVLGYFVLQASMAAMKDNPQMQQVPPGMLGIMQSLGVVMVPVGWLLSAIWPVFLLIWFRRAKIRASMAAWG